MAALKALVLLCLVVSAFSLPSVERENVSDKEATTTSSPRETKAAEEVKSQGTQSTPEPQPQEKERSIKSEEKPLDKQQDIQPQEKSTQPSISPESESRSEPDLSKQQPSQQFQGQTQDSSIDDKSFRQPFQDQQRQMRTQDQGQVQDQISRPQGQDQLSPEQKQFLVYSLLQYPRRESVKPPCPFGTQGQQRNIWKAKTTPSWQNIYQAGQRPFSSRHVTSRGLSPFFDSRPYIYRDLSDELEDLYGIDSSPESPESEEYYLTSGLYSNPNLWAGRRILKRDVGQQTTPQKSGVGSQQGSVQDSSLDQKIQGQQKQGIEGISDTQMKSDHRHVGQRKGDLQDDKGPFKQTHPFEAEVDFFLGNDKAHLNMKFPEGKGNYEVHDGRGSVRVAEFNVDNRGNFKLLDKKESREAPSAKRTVSFNAGNVNIDLTLQPSEQN